MFGHTASLQPDRPWDPGYAPDKGCSDCYSTNFICPACMGIKTVQSIYNKKVRQHRYRLRAVSRAAR
ncbi:MAG: hypothetical protein DRH50_09695 [Deltaproteobacteria bacterium]|nr:MAG: hypothetical protein DRH50_09695 [Deltaproteobacteria bacterium]